MKLEFIDLGKLAISPANMRMGKKAPDISDILPSIRARGVLVPILVRPGLQPDSFEIVAGQRRFLAARTIAAETGTDEPMPCAILEEHDDAAALEASLIENLARLNPDEVCQWESFTRLVKEGRTSEEIASTFGLPALMVRRILALGNLLPAIRESYRRQEIDAASIRLLTMASKKQQKDWLTLHEDEYAHAPTGQQLKSWLMGGQSIAVRHALFDLDAYKGQILADLFGEDRYFAEAGQFWVAQNEAIEERRTAFLEAGWSDAVILAPSDYFHGWEYEKTPKRKGGKVYIDVRASGEVSFHEGYLSHKEARRREAAEVASPGIRSRRPEMSGPLQTYVDLHRHAAVRAAMIDHGWVALRLMVAHVITGSSLWHVRVEPQTARNEHIAESIETSAAEAAFDARRRLVLDLLGFSSEEPTLIGGTHDMASLFLRLIDLSDTALMEVAAIAMGESLAAGSGIIEPLGQHLGIDMRHVWQADDAFFELLRDREVLGCIMSEVAGEDVASANAGDKVKTAKAIIRDYLEGRNGRSKVASWVPRWMAFPASFYTARGGITPPVAPEIEQEGDIPETLPEAA